VIIQIKIFEDIGIILTLLFGSNLFLGLCRKKTPAIKAFQMGFQKPELL
jgi:hypothetical protein